MNFEERIKKNIENKDSYGNSNSKKAFSTSGYDIDFLKPEKGKMFLDILPYRAGTDHHPAGIKKGAEDYVLEYYEHRNVGAAKHNFLCMQMMYNKPCPICEEREALKKQDNADKKIITSLYPKKRVLYNVIDTKNKEAGIMLFAAAHFSYEKELLIAIQEEQEESGAIICFPDLENGKTVMCQVREDDSLGYTFLKFSSFSFRDRENPYNKKMVEKTIPLDSLLVIPTYEEVDNEFFGKEPEPIQSEPVKAKDPVKTVDEEEPPFTSPSERKEEKAIACPYGYKLGSYDEHQECKMCEGSEEYAECEKH